MTSNKHTVQSRQREQWVDTLRVVLISGVIVVHTATAYVTDFVGYYYDDERVTNSVVSIALALPALMGGIFGLGPLFGGGVVLGSVTGSAWARWLRGQPPAAARRTAGVLRARGEPAGRLPG